MGEKKYGIDPAILQQYAEEIKKVKDMGVEIAIVIEEVIFLEVSKLKSPASIEFKATTWACLRH